MPADVYSLAWVLISIIAHTDEPKPTADSASSRAVLFDGCSLNCGVESTSRASDACRSRNHSRGPRTRAGRPALGARDRSPFEGYLLAVLQRQEADRVNASDANGADVRDTGCHSEGLDSTNCLQVNVVGGFLAANPAAMGRTDRLGRYRILEKIGQGGMGAVFKAEDKADGTIVAIKRLNPGISADRQSLHRFQKEARLLAEARHPNIANLLEINEDQGMHYLVMEYVSGTDLKRRCWSAGRSMSGWPSRSWPMLPAR